MIANLTLVKMVVPALTVSMDMIVRAPRDLVETHAAPVSKIFRTKSLFCSVVKKSSLGT